MKKLVAVLVILAIAIPSMGATTVSCAVSGTPANTGAKFLVNYAYDSSGSFPRAFALDITTSLGTISGVTASKVGESIVGSTGFGIFPGTIAIDSTGSVTSAGVPVAPLSDLPSGTLGGIGTSGVTVELGSLYATSAAKPANSGTILTIAITCASSTAARTATITVANNVARGGLVLEDATTATAAATLNIPIPGGVCKGNVNGDASVTGSDVTALVGKLNSFGGSKKTIPSSSTNFSLAGDADLNGSNTGADVTKIVGWLNSYGGSKKTITCPHTYN